MDNDVLRNIFSIAGLLLCFPRERADFQKSLMFTCRQFCRIILDSPIVSLNEALQVRDPLAANVALRRAARMGCVHKELLKWCPQVVGAALRLRSKRTWVPTDPFTIYVDNLASIIKNLVIIEFGDEIRPGCGHYHMSLTTLMNHDSWCDEWKTLANLILKRKTLKMKTLVHAAKIAFSNGDIECLKLLTGYIPELMPRSGILVKAVLMKHGCDYLCSFYRGSSLHHVPFKTGDWGNPKIPWMTISEMMMDERRRYTVLQRIH